MRWWVPEGVRMNCDLEEAEDCTSCLAGVLRFVRLSPLLSSILRSFVTCEHRLGTALSLPVAYVTCPSVLPNRQARIGTQIVCIERPSQGTKWYPQCIKTERSMTHAPSLASFTHPSETRPRPPRHLPLRRPPPCRRPRARSTGPGI